MTWLDGLAPLRGPGTADVIADRLRGLILDGTFAPGDPVNEVHLAAALEMSRGPVRAAVQRLVQEGLLVSVRHRGTSVVRLGAGDIADVYRARLAVEREAARAVLDADGDGDGRAARGRAAAGMAECLAAMGAAVTDRDWAGVARADLAFHRTVVDAARSPRLSKMFATLMAETLLCIHEMRDLYDPPALIVDHHRRLADLFSAGAPEPYLAELDWHLRNSVTRLTAARAGGDSAPGPG